MITDFVSMNPEKYESIAWLALSNRIDIGDRFSYHTLSQ